MGDDSFRFGDIIPESEEYNLRSLESKQNKSLWLTGRPAITTLARASSFLRSVGIALRYWPSKGIPLASMYQACTGNNKEKDQGQRGAIELTNGLLETCQAIEINMIAGRICLLDNTLAPALFRLVTRERPYNQLPKLSSNAHLAYDLLSDRGEITAGDLRKKMGVKSGLQEDPAYQALAELQRHLLVDRGPFTMPGKGIPYLSKEGYPYHFFHEAHLELVTAAQELTDKQAAEIFLSSYLNGSVFCPANKMISIFQSFLSAHEIEDVLKGLFEENKILLIKSGRQILVCSRH